MKGALNEPVAIVDLGAFECPECLSINADFLRIKSDRRVIRGGTSCCPRTDGREIGQEMSINEAVCLLRTKAEDSESNEYREIVKRVIGFLRGRFAFPETKDLIKK